MTQPLHILNEAASPIEAWTEKMWCGAEAITFDDEIDGYTVIPEGMDWYLESAADKATCQACKDAFDTRHVLAASLKKKENA